MFRETAEHRLINDDGVEVSRDDRYVMRYQHGDHVLMLYCEAIVDDNGRFGDAIVLPYDPHWEPPFDHEPIDDAQRHVIAEHLLEAWGLIDGYWVKIETGQRAV